MFKHIVIGRGILTHQLTSALSEEKSLHYNVFCIKPDYSLTCKVSGMFLSQICKY